MKRIYTPNQIQTATFLGGPLAAAYTLNQSFKNTDNKFLAKWSVIVGIVAFAVIIIAIPFLPERTPNNLIPLLCVIPVALLLKKHYLTKKEILDCEDYKVESNWKVLAITLLSFAIYIVPVFASIHLFESSDDIANRVVENINKMDIELNPQVAFHLKAEKDPNGAGIFINIALNKNAVEEFSEADDQKLREIVVDFVGVDTVRYLAKHNIYVIFKFHTVGGKPVREVILSASNLNKFGR